MIWLLFNWKKFGFQTEFPRLFTFECRGNSVWKKVCHVMFLFAVFQLIPWMFWTPSKCLPYFICLFFEFHGTASFWVSWNSLSIFVLRVIIPSFLYTLLLWSAFVHFVCSKVSWCEIWVHLHIWKGVALVALVFLCAQEIFEGRNTQELCLWLSQKRVVWLVMICRL